MPGVAVRKAPTNDAVFDPLSDMVIVSGLKQKICNCKNLYFLDISIFSCYWNVMDLFLIVPRAC